MRIALVIDYLKTGGAERQILLTARELGRIGHHVEIITYRSDVEFEEFIRANHISVVSITAQGLTRIGRIWKLSRHLRKGRFDVVHAFKGTATLFAALAARIAGINPVFGGYRAEYVQGRCFRAAHRSVDKLLSGWIVNSQTIADSMCATVGINAKKLFIVYNVIDPQRFISGLSKHDAKLKFGISSDEYTVTQVARLCPEKNHYLFLDMAALLLKQQPDVKFMIVGDGPLREPLQNRSRALGISHKVMFLGTRSDIPDILMATDVSVLTSDREGFPNALIESMSIGVPVVMTDFKAAAELITDGTQGFIVPRNNPAALAERIQLLIRDADLRQSIGREGKNLIEQRFSPSVMVQKLIAVYDTGIKHTLSFQNNMGTVSKSVP